MKISPPPRIQTILLAVLAIGVISIALGDAYGQTDNTKPVIAISKANVQTISVNADIPDTVADMETGSFYFDLFGATCTDNVDGKVPIGTDGNPDFSISSIVNSDSTVNRLIQSTIAVGDWEVIFHCDDTVGNYADSPQPTPIVRVVAANADTTPPTLTITNSHQSIVYNTDITKSSITTLFGITCTDTESSADYIYTSSPTYDKTTARDYTLTFTCTDGSGNSAPTQTRTLTVQAQTTADNTPPTPTPTPTPTTSTTSSSVFIPPPPNTGSQIFVDLWHVQVKSPYGSGAVWETYLLERDISGWEKTYEVTKIAFLKAGYYDVNDNFLYGFNEWKTIYLNSQSP